MASQTNIVRICEVADWRLDDENFVRMFRIPSKSGNYGTLAVTNPFPRTARICFDEENHSYTIDGIRAPRSVTSLLHSFSSPFNPKIAIEAMRTGRDWCEKRKQLEIQGVDPDSDQDIARHWGRAGEVGRKRGTLLHFHAEMYANSVPIEYPWSPELHQVVAILDVLSSDGWLPYRAEINIFHCQLRVAGQPDLILRNATGHLAILDWKRVPKLHYDNAFTSLQYPLDHLPDSSYWLYALQLNLYRFIIESAEYGSGFQVAKMWLAVVHPTLASPQLVTVPRLQNEMIELLRYEAQGQRATMDCKTVDDLFAL